MRVDMSFRPVLRRIVEKSAPGRTPSFGEAHVVKALELASGEGIGRAALGARLGVGEGVARTLIRHLRDADLIEVTAKGITTSTRGGLLLRDIRTVIQSVGEAPSTDDTVGRRNYAVLVRGAAGGVRAGVEQRDAALLSGAKGATTIVYGDDPRIPGMERTPDPALRELVEGAANPKRGDVIIIGTGDSLLSAELGALSAALGLV
jgi:hypothetical protein